MNWIFDIFHYSVTVRINLFALRAKAGKFAEKRINYIPAPAGGAMGVNIVGCSLPFGRSQRGGVELTEALATATKCLRVIMRLRL